MYLWEWMNEWIGDDDTIIQGLQWSVCGTAAAVLCFWSLLLLSLLYHTFLFFLLFFFLSIFYFCFFCIAIYSIIYEHFTCIDFLNWGNSFYLISVSNISLLSEFPVCMFLLPLAILMFLCIHIPYLMSCGSSSTPNMQCALMHWH